MTRRVVGPFNRVEGDLEVTLDIQDGVIASAYVNAPLFRGFEQMLLGKAPEDAMVLVPRICGICSVAQSAASAAAIAAASGVVVPPNGRLAANLTQAAENAADHLTHFYMFFMPDFAHRAYANEPWYEATATRFRAIHGAAVPEMLSSRTAFMRVMGLLAGKWPHTLSLQPGGSSRPLQASEKIRLFRMVREFRDFLERAVYADKLENVTAIQSVDALMAWAQERADRADFARFLMIADKLELHKLGHSDAVLMSAGVYREEQGMWFAKGVYAGADEKLVPESINEDVRYSHYSPSAEPKAPLVGETQPTFDKEGAYTFCKAPRLGGRVVETGAFARQMIDKHPLARDLYTKNGASVTARIVGRLLELARIVPAMEQWAQALQPAQPYCEVAKVPDVVDSYGLVEAARGSLGHWLSVREGKIRNYQIIAPTTWNFSPRDSQGTPGALEQALVGVHTVDSNNVSPAVFHIVRSFDPCMVCTVH